MAESTNDAFSSCVVFMLGYPGMGKRTVGGELAKLIDGVLVDNALINRPVLELLRWDGVEPLPVGVWNYVAPIRKAVLRAIEDIAPPSNSYVFTNVIEETPSAADEYAVVRSLARRRGSLFLAVMLTCDLDIQVRRVDNPDRVALRKGSDPDGYRAFTLATSLYQPPSAEVIQVDTSETAPADNARIILNELRDRGFTADSAVSTRVD